MITCNSALASRRRFLPCCELSRGEEEKRGGDRRLSVGWKGRWRFLPAQRGSTFTARKDWNEGKKGGRKMARACFAAARNAHARSLVRISPPRRRVRVSSILMAVYRSVSILETIKPSMLLHFCLNVLCSSCSLSACLSSSDRFRNRGRSSFLFLFICFTYAREFCFEINLINTNHIGEIVFFFFVSTVL